MESSVANRIRKLIALATGNANEHERLVAMEAAQKLLDEHNLSMFDIEGEVHRASDVDHKALREIKLQPWVRIIMHCVCKLYNTTFFMRKHAGESYHPVVIGTPENIEVTLDIATWLITSITKESKITFKMQKERNSFKLGAAQRLFERVEELLTKPAETTSGAKSTQLSVVRNALQVANQEYLQQLLPNARTNRTRPLYSSNAGYSAGREFGNSMSLDKQIKSNPEPQPDS
ncbi:MAG: DUF2786 domain-containing protein [Cyanobacteria bacterium SZAS-4]|nr:DUF2786 domain-containing protein [Cyanobacteria bacterium SZAS-4]